MPWTLSQTLANGSELGIRCTSPSGQRYFDVIELVDFPAENRAESYRGFRSVLFETGKCLRETKLKLCQPKKDVPSNKILVPVHPNETTDCLRTESVIF